MFKYAVLLFILIDLLISLKGLSTVRIPSSVSMFCYISTASAVKIFVIGGKGFCFLE